MDSIFIDTLKFAGLLAVVCGIVWQIMSRIYFPDLK